MIRQAGWVVLCAAGVLLGASGCRERVVIHPREVEYAPPPPVAPRNVDVAFFYDRLAPYGTWSRHGGHGWVWAPANVPIGWRPYSNGHWVYSDDNGWLWVSNWAWGWAPFHYGRWVYDESYGWFWLPDRQWGPAWVAWRHGGGYVGWAPLPPKVRWAGRLERHGYNLNHIHKREWVFVREAQLLHPIRERMILPHRNVTIFGATRDVTRIVAERGHIAVRSVPLDRVEKAVGRRVTRVKVYDAPSAEATRLPRERDDHIRIFRPRVVDAPPSARPPDRQELQRRYAVRDKQLQERHEAEREVLDRRHKAELRTSGKRADVVRKRHEAEREALRTENQRRQRLLRQRRQPARPRPQPQPAKSDKPSKRSRDQRD